MKKARNALKYEKIIEEFDNRRQILQKWDYEDVLDSLTERFNQIEVSISSNVGLIIYNINKRGEIKLLVKETSDKEFNTLPVKESSEFMFLIHDALILSKTVRIIPTFFKKPICANKSFNKELFQQITLFVGTVTEEDIKDADLAEGYKFIDAGEALNSMSDLRYTIAISRALSEYCVSLYWDKLFLAEKFTDYLVLPLEQQKYIYGLEYFVQKLSNHYPDLTSEEEEKNPLLKLSVLKQELKDYASRRHNQMTTFGFKQDYENKKYIFADAIGEDYRKYLLDADLLEYIDQSLFKSCAASKMFIQNDPQEQLDTLFKLNTNDEDDEEDS